MKTSKPFWVEWSTAEKSAAGILAVLFLIGVISTLGTLFTSASTSTSTETAQTKEISPGCTLVTADELQPIGIPVIQSEIDFAQIFSLENLYGEATWCENNLSVTGSSLRDGNPDAENVWTLSYSDASKELDFSFESERGSWNVAESHGGILVTFLPDDKYFMAQFIRQQSLGKHIMMPGSVIRISK